MQSYLTGFALLWVSVALQGAWPFWLRVGGQPPNLVVAAVACLGLVRGPTEGCLAGLVAAVLVAGAAHAPIGGLLVAFMAVGALAGLLRGSLFAERVPVAMLVAVIAVVIASFLQMVFVPPPGFVVWLSGTVVSALYTVLVVPPIYWLARLTRPRDRLR